MSTKNWKQILSQSITAPEELAEIYPNAAGVLSAQQEVVRHYPMFINPYYLGLIKQPGDPLWKQAVPDRQELTDTQGLIDPLAEEIFSPVPNITHRYPDRVLFLVSNRCALYCRFCTRKRKIGRSFTVNDATLKEGLAYIRDRKNIRDVLVSGGDPLLLENDMLADILAGVRAIPHVDIIRIGTRLPCVLPQRITPRLARILKQFHPVYINTHFNHPDEITAEAARACAVLADAGIPLGCQTVLLRGVNDSAAVMQKLMQKLLAIRTRPYYLHHMDLTCGTRHFRTSIQTGLEIINSLRGYTSGMGIPHYVIDLPGGGGKVPLLSQYIIGIEEDEVLLKNYQGNITRYPVSQTEAAWLSRNLIRAGGDTGADILQAGVRQPRLSP